MAKILVVGPGALGALFAARLGAAGHEVLVAARTPETADAIAQHGVQVRGESRQAVTVATEPTADVDLIIIATKCQTAVEAARQWSAGECPVLCLQNGLMGDALADVLGDRLIECTVGFPATLTGPGQAEQTGPGKLHIGRWPSGSQGLEHVAAWLQSVAPTEVSDNMVGVKWTKLLINSAATSLGALTGLSMGELMKQELAGKAFLGIVLEGHAVGRGRGIRFEPVSGLRPGLFAGIVRVGLGPALLRILARKYGRMKASSLQGLERGQKTEVDFLNAAIAGPEAPINEAMVKLLHEVESGTTSHPTLLARLPL